MLLSVSAIVDKHSLPTEEMTQVGPAWGATDMGRDESKVRGVRWLRGLMNVLLSMHKAMLELLSL